MWWKRLLRFLGFGSTNGQEVSVVEGTEKEEQQEWVMDPHHSRIIWRVIHMGLTEVEGTFKEFDGKLKGTPPHFHDLTGEVVIKVASVDSYQPIRDGHLKSKDFFDVETYPEIRFQIKRVVPQRLNRFKLEGDLTIKGVTKPVTLEGKLVSYTKGDALFKMKKAGFELRGTLKRSDFGVIWPQEKDLLSQEGAPVLSDEVKVEVHTEIGPPAMLEAYNQLFQQMAG